IFTTALILFCTFCRNKEQGIKTFESKISIKEINSKNEKLVLSEIGNIRVIQIIYDSYHQESNLALGSQERVIDSILDPIYKIEHPIPLPLGLYPSNKIIDQTSLKHLSNYIVAKCTQRNDDS